MRQRNFLRLISLTMLTVLLAYLPVNAQDMPVISLHLPLLPQGIPDQTIADFEAEYGVRVHVEADPTVHYMPSVSDNPQAYLDGLQQYVQRADVIYVDRYTVNGIGAVSGFLLDIAPLADGDTAYNPADFHPAVRDAFRWDGQLLALPVSFDNVVMGYNAAAFDAAGIGYPSGRWTISEFAAAARALTQRDAAGAVVRPGYESSAFDTVFIQSMVQQSLLDSSQFPAQLNTTDAQLTEVLTVWQQLRAEGVIGRGDNMANTVSTLTLMPSSTFENSGASAALLPNNRAGVDAGGFAISAGTANPQLAYALIRTLTESTELVASTRDTYGARLAMPMQHAVSQPAATVLESALTVSMPSGDLRYDDYLMQVLSSDNPAVALNDAVLNLQSALQQAQQVGANTTLVVDAPPAIGEGAVLRFGVSSNILPLPNQDVWNLAVEDFVATDADVGWIEVEGSMVMPDQYASTYDCFAVSYDWIKGFDPASLTRLDPLMMQDTGFNPDAFIPTVYDTVNQNGQVVAYPLTLTPYYMTINDAQLSNQGIAISEGWTVDQFVDAAIQWHGNTGLPLYNLGDNHDVLTLLAAYGAMPLNTMTTPPTVHFTSPETINGLQQILGLARDGQLGYTAMTELQGMGGAPAATPLQSHLMVTSSFGLAATGGAQQISYPGGNDVTVASHRLIAGAIGSETAYADACYRWLRFISEQTTIYRSMPVLTDLVNRTQSPFMTGYLQLLQQPDLINVPYIQRVGSTDTFVLAYLLNQAMDAHVLAGEDLMAALQSAQENADLYLQCRAGDTVRNCATSIVPAIESVLR